MPNRSVAFNVCCLAPATLLAGEPSPDTIEVAASTGTGEEHATRRAVEDAVFQAGGVINANTIVDNDETVCERVITAYSALVTGVKRIGEPIAAATL